jgi:general secretion pathway protein D
VNWFFDNAVPAELAATRPNAESFGLVGGSVAQGRNAQGGFTGAASTLMTFTRRNAAAIVDLLDSSTDLRVLSTPSIFVRNNAEAQLNVGQNLAVESTSFNPGTGTGGTINNVQYLQTGTKLKVKPRIGGDGMVFLEIEQEISSPSDVEGANGNPNVNSRVVTTEAIVRDGDTVMLAGLISQVDGRGTSGLPGLSRAPFIGGLFGRQSRSTDRTEVVVLITPRVVRNAQETRTLTDDYIQRFQGLAPLRAPGEAPATPAADPPPGG